MGSAERALAAVDRYKTAQVLAFASIYVVPASLISAVAVLAVVGLAVAAFAFALGPMFGWAVGEMGSRIYRRGRRIPNDRVAAGAMRLTEVAELAILAGAPAVVAFAIVAVARALGLP